jgi:hypothetical protein
VIPVKSFNTEYQAAPNVKVMINIGALMDIITGVSLKGFHGESILNGGLGNLTGVVGVGNNFKSTVLHYFTMAAMEAMCSGPRAESSTNSYDTEINIHEWHLRLLLERFPNLHRLDIFETMQWLVTDKTVYMGDEWYDILKAALIQKRKDAKKHSRATPFMNRDRNSYLEILTPTFTQVDSLSEFVTQDVVKMQDDNSLGEAGGNMVSMRQGMQKNRFLMEIPALAAASYNYTLLTAHLGDEFNMDPRNPKARKLHYLPQNVKLKGVPEKFTFLMNTCWHCYNAAPLRQQDSKTPTYPRDADDDLKGDTDLSSVMVRLIRNKSGPTGMVVELIVSQSEGVLPTLTEFHHIKENGRYGLVGSLQNYALAIRPDVKLSRTTVRGKIDTDPLLCRAIRITSDMCQMNDLWHHLEKDFLCTPEQLYNDLKAKGYDWDVLLATRPYWALDNDNPTPFLSTTDLLNMRQGTYHPYWMALLPGMTERPGNDYVGVMPDAAKKLMYNDSGFKPL